jgi:iron complex outermembrane receptor protein
VGFDYALGSRLNMNASLYYAQGNDFMYYTSTGQTIDMGYAINPVSMRKNISQVEIYGLEAEITIKLIERLNMFMNYAYNHSKIAEYTVVNPMIDVNLTNKYLTDVAPHLFSAGVNYSWNWLRASAFCKYTDKMWINDYNGYDDLYLMAYQYPSVFMVDARFGVLFSEHVNLAVSVQNILDKRFYDSKGLISPGRIATGILTLSL